jgi:hypothetical protein
MDDGFGHVHVSTEKHDALKVGMDVMVLATWEKKATVDVLRVLNDPMEVLLHRLECVAYRGRENPSDVINLDSEERRDVADAEFQWHEIVEKSVEKASDELFPQFDQLDDDFLAQLP